MKTWNEWAKEIHENAVAHGWWETEPPLPRTLALMVSELYEAIEEERRGREAFYYDGDKPEGTAVEVCDALIRALDYLGKAEYNADDEIKTLERFRYAECYMRDGTFDDLSQFALVLGQTLSNAYCYWRTDTMTSNESDKFGQDITCEYVCEFVYMIYKWFGYNHYDLEETIRIKNDYNKTRPYKHGKAF